MKLANHRRVYDSSGLDRHHLQDDPVEQFKTWLQQAIDAQVTDATAMVLATVSRDGGPWQRTVLLKECDHRGFFFYTNLGSRKAEEIAADSRVSLLFRWQALNRQVSIAGRAHTLPATDVLKYFSTRPRDSRLAAWTSAQSQPLASREVLEDKYAEIKQRFSHGEVPLPSFWGGYRVEPQYFEYWQGRPSRLHDRFTYRPESSGYWKIERLAP